MTNSPFDEPAIDDRSNERELDQTSRGWAPPPPGASWREPPPVPPAELPPLRIHHLMTITAVTAIVFAFSRLVLPLDRLLAEQGTNAFLPIALLILFSIGFTTFAFQCLWWWRRLPAFRQPGQWLMLIFPGSIAASLGIMLAVQWLVSNRINGPGDRGLLIWISIANIAVTLISTAFYVYSAWRIADTRPWRILFGFVVMRQLYQLLLAVDQFLFGFTFTRFLVQWNVAPGMQGMTCIYTVATVINLLLLVWAIARDRSLHRHWSHWVGVALLAIVYAVQVASIAFAVVQALRR